MTSTLIPKLTSKYIPDRLHLRSDADADDDEDSGNEDILAETSKGMVHTTPSSSFFTSSTSFVIDKTPGSDNTTVLNPIKKKDRYNPSIKLVSSLDPGKELKGYLPTSSKDIKDFMNHDCSAEKIYKDKCVLIRNGFMTDMTISSLEESKRAMKRLRKKEAAKTAGRDWYNLPAQEVTPEIEADVKLLNMRQSLDPKRFYKRNSGIDKLKYFNVGTIIGPKADFYNDLSKRQKKRTFVEEFMADSEAKKWQRSKFKELIKNNPQYLKMRKKMEKKKKQTKFEMVQAAMTAKKQEDDSGKKLHSKRIKKQDKHNVFKKSRMKSNH